MSTASTQQPRFQNHARASRRNQRSLPTRDTRWSKARIAELSCEEIGRMTCDEMVHVIRAAQMAVIRPEVERRLPFYDHQTLQRLVYLARRCCRHQGY